MKKKLLYITIINLFFGYTVLLSQINLGGIPYSQKNGKSMEDISIYETGKIDLDLLKKQDAEDLIKRTPPRFGSKFEVNLNLNNAGRWEILPNGDKIWYLKIKTQNSLAINFIFSRFHLSSGSKLFIYRPDYKQILGAFSDLNNKGDIMHIEKFGTGFIYGDEAVLELYQPKANLNIDILEIESIVHGYRMIKVPQELKSKNGLKNFGDSDGCNVNVNCSEGNDWQDEKTGVAMMIVDGFRFCTGCLVNNQKNDGKLYFLTADHCINQSPGNNFSALTFMWDYESATCSNPASEPSTSKVTTGSVLKSSNSNSDFALLELVESPYSLTPPYRAYLNGWSRINSPIAGGVGIHHPSGDIKKISTFSNIPQAGVTFNPSTHWNVQWIQTTTNFGITEGGSSGSPIFMQNKLIFGQLHGGPSFCNANNSDKHDDYGRLSTSWNGATSNNRLKDWLDPLGTNITEHGGGYLESCQNNITVNTTQNQKKTYLSSNNIYASSIINNNVEINMEAGNSIIMSDGFHAKYASNFSALIKSCTPRVILKMTKIVDPLIKSNSPILPNISIYPNPATNNSILKVENILEGNISILIRDVQGRVLSKLEQTILHSGSYETKLDLSEYLNGIYLVSVNMKDYQETLKIKVDK